MPKSIVKYPRRSKRLTFPPPLQISSRASTLQWASDNAPGEPLSPLQRILPKDIIGHILFCGYLDSTPHQVSAIRSVCRQFTSLAQAFSTSLDARPRLSQKKKMTFNTRVLSNVMQQFPSLREVDFSFLGDAFIDRHLQVLSPLRAHLRVLKLRGTAVGDKGLLNFLGCAKGTRNSHSPLPLEVLDLSKTYSKDRNRIGRISMEAVVSLCPNLKSLLLSLCRKINDDIMDIIASKLNNLQLVDVSMCSITPRGCCHLARLSSLRIVNISSVSCVNGQAIQSLVTGYCPPNYNKFGDEFTEDEDSTEKADVSSDYKAAFGKITNVSNLTAITAQFATSGADERLFETLLRHAPHLKYLDLRNYLGDDVNTRSLSPVKLSVRKLTRNGTSIAFSRTKG
ncbi:hypothetical protein HJC23_006172 [Cyclotella cryptica]|uniref:F-box domain-containing protein n=1 Tax=Cyclotella cryptica TaxID=29204 RepID=A0ABD3Q0G0_9STRA|eukprot:CCRYP_009802-RA/>CCRYP_009802-RA protein AED:0.03 eAED:0.03 QI:352/1/1/1/0.33/0.25/4/865/395